VLLTITTTHAPATDLGYLLHKHPDRVQEFAQSFGTATVFYPEADEERCTAALVLDVDPVRLARSRTKSPDFTLAQYVNDRSYAASSLLGVALADVFSTARAGICRSRQDLADSPIPLELRIPVLPCRGGADVAHRKRSLAEREHALGVEALRRFVGNEPLWRVHEAVFGVLALESEPVDPRL
jgi:3' terminal RNA ribose 2'-O-methyltransferase Hen1